MVSDGPVFFDELEQCVDLALRRVGKRIVLGVPLGLGKPNPLVNAFYRRAQEDPGVHLKILTALSLERPLGASDLERRFLEPFVARIFGADFPDLEYALALRRGEMPPNVELCEFYFKPGGALNCAVCQENYISTNFTFVARDIVDNGVNVLCQLVAKRRTPEGLTRYSLSSNSDVTLDALQILKDKGRPFVSIAQVNPHLPFMYGDAEVEPSAFHAVLEHPSLTFPLFSTPKMSVTTADFMIGLYVSTLIRDGGTLQIGIGSLGDALVYGLLLRHRDNDVYRQLLAATGALEAFGGAIGRLGGLEPFSQGLYGSTEMLVDGYLHLLNGGVVKRKVYNHVPLQKLLNQGRIGEEVSGHTLDALLEAGAVHPVLTGEDVSFLREIGVFREGVRLDQGRLHNDGVSIEADLGVTRNRDKIVAHCLGERLRGGFLIHAAFFLGPRSFYDALNTMGEEERRQIFMTSVLHVNHLYGNRYASEELKRLQRKDARFVNAALMFTLTGAVVSDGLETGQVVSGVGGQYNFVAMAHALPGAHSLIMARSTRSRGGDLRSNIVWNYGHTTIPRHLRDIHITEYGIADLRGRPDKDVVAATIQIADSRFQEELVRQAKANGKLPRDYRVPDRFRNNMPERLEEVLKPYRERGLFPAFPFGTDFTREELVLGKALRGLKEEMAARKIPLPSLKEARKVLMTPEAARPYLERLKLDRPSNARETMMQKMVIYALASQGAI